MSRPSAFAALYDEFAACDAQLLVEVVSTPGLGRLVRLVVSLDGMPVAVYPAPDGDLDQAAELLADCPPTEGSTPRQEVEALAGEAQRHGFDLSIEEVAIGVHHPDFGVFARHPVVEGDLSSAAAQLSRYLAAAGWLGGTVRAFCAACGAERPLNAFQRPGGQPHELLPECADHWTGTSRSHAAPARHRHQGEARTSSDGLRRHQQPGKRKRGTCAGSRGRHLLTSNSTDKDIPVRDGVGADEVTRRAREFFDAQVGLLPEIEPWFETLPPEAREALVRERDRRVAFRAWFLEEFGGRS